MHNCTCEREKLMRTVQAYNFILVDLSLYLNTHPTCRKALACYQKNKTLREQAVAAYTAKFGPLTHANVNSVTQWDWVNNPWPWELEG